MAYDTVIRHAVRSAYVHSKQPLAQASANAGVPESTARRWKSDAKRDGDDWDAARLNIGAEMQQKQVADFLDLFMEFQTGIINDLITGDETPENKAVIASRVSDAFVKMAKAGGRFDPSHLMLVATQNTLKELGHLEGGTCFLFHFLRQQGQNSRDLTRVCAMRIRRVAIELGLCLCSLAGGGWFLRRFGKGKLRDDFGFSWS